jgi:hypothetical protein
VRNRAKEEEKKEKMEEIIGHELVKFVTLYEGEVVEWVTRTQSIAPWLVERGYEILSVVALTVGMVL